MQTVLAILHGEELQSKRHASSGLRSRNRTIAAINFVFGKELEELTQGLRRSPA